MEMNQKAAHYDHAHVALDMLSVPRKDEHGQTLTVAGRIDWMKEHVRDLEEQIIEAQK